MNIERYLRLIAGIFVLSSLLLAFFHHPYWLGFTAFVSLNLIQSGITDRCPLIPILRRLGVKSAVELAGSSRT